MQSFKLLDIIKVKSRFGRSVNLERDFYNRVSLEGYVLTITAQEALLRFAKAFSDPIASRAWTLTGPYGSGKSAFALFAAKIFSPQIVEETIFGQNLVKHKNTNLWHQLFGESAKIGNLIPILVSGSREPIAQALLRGLKTALKNAQNEDLQSILVRADDLFKRFETDKAYSEKQVIELIKETADILSTSKNNTGLIIIIDELGKLLEFAAFRPAESDVFLLQELAEATKSTNSNIFLITILHQAFERYSERLGQSEQAEWGKIQGRFEDLPFQEPNEQLLRILQSAFEQKGTSLQRQTLRKAGDELAHKAIKLGLCGSIKQSEAIEILHDCLPLHPLVVLSLGLIFRRFGQNERSLFAFLTANEHFGLPEFLENTIWSENQYKTFRLDKLYDYLIAAMGSALLASPEGRKWAEVESALNRLIDPTELEVRIIKIIGLLKLIGDFGNLKSSREVISFALEDETNGSRQIDKAITGLKKKSIIIERRYNNTLAIWEGSDIDLDECFREAQKFVDPMQSLSESLTKNFHLRPFVAKRHSLQKGTLRFFETVYADSNDLLNVSQKPLNNSDGRIVYALAVNREELGKVKAKITEDKSLHHSQIIFVIPPGIDKLRDAIFETACWHWVKRNIPELENDRTARIELTGRIAFAEQSVLDWLNSITGDANYQTAEKPEHNCIWFWQGEEIFFDSVRGFQEFLSSVCDTVFHGAPTLRNELINRRSLSSSSTTARKLLLEAMLSDSNKIQLGIEGYPPQLSMYFSLLQKTTIHREENGKLGFFPPQESAERGIKFVWQKIEEFLLNTESNRGTVAGLFQELQEAPLGLKTGILPVLACAAFLHYDTEIAIYERGTFLPKLTMPVVERLIKNPENFTLQFCRISGVRVHLLEELLTTIQPSDTKNKKPALLSVVRPLTRFVSDLYDYTRQTSHISSVATGIRRVLLSAREPDKLLFKQLPEVCGFSEFKAQGEYNKEEASKFCQVLQEGLAELNLAYVNLLNNIEQTFKAAFSLDRDGDDARVDLQERIKLVAEYVVEPKMKSFVLRANNKDLDFRSWLESLASLLTSKPPEVWLDTDIIKFEISLAEIARSFSTLETLSFELKSRSDKRLPKGGELIRLGITVLGEVERQKVITISKNDKARIAEIEEVIEEAFLQSHVNGNLELRLAVLANISHRLITKLEIDEGSYTTPS